MSTCNITCDLYLFGLFPEMKNGAYSYVTDQSYNESEKLSDLCMVVTSNKRLLLIACGQLYKYNFVMMVIA